MASPPPPEFDFWPEHRGPTTVLEDGTAFPSSVQYRVTIRQAKPDDMPPVVFSLRLEVVDGRPAATAFALIAGDRPIRTTDLRQVPFGDMVEAAAKHAARAQAIMAKSFSGYSSVDDKNRAAADAADAVGGKLGGRRVITDSLLRRVAQIYQANEATGSPTAEVASQLITSHRNATRWVAIARERGFLPPYKEGN